MLATASLTRQRFLCHIDKILYVLRLPVNTALCPQSPNRAVIVKIPQPTLEMRIGGTQRKRLLDSQDKKRQIPREKARQRLPGKRMNNWPSVGFQPHRDDVCRSFFTRPR